MLAEKTQGVQAFRVGPRAWGLQFHAEVTRESVASWLREHARPGKALPARGPIDRGPLTAETDVRIEEWNELGRAVCAAFLRSAGG